MIRIRGALRATGLLAAFTLAVSAGCGGGGVGSGGTGITLGGLAQGPVTGFGSVIVDGARYDDSKIATLREDEPGHDVKTEARLGDIVELAFSGDNVATRLEVEPTVVGRVASVGLPGNFVVLGQVVTINADPARGPVTQFGGGYVDATSVVAGDALEVHGLIIPRTGGYTVQATRIEKLAALPRFLKVRGLVSAAGADGFRCGPLTIDTRTASLLPKGTTLGNGQIVSVLAAADTLREDVGGTPHVTASQVRIQQVGSVGEAASVSGKVGDLDLGSARFELGGVKVRSAGAMLVPSGTVLREDLYVRVDGVARTDGSIDATTITLRDGSAEPDGEVKGNIDGYVAATQSFQVRGVQIDASHATLEGCPGGKLANGLYVDVEGSLTTDGMAAKKVHCEDEPGDATIERKGRVESVDTGGRTLSLALEKGGSLVVRWTDATYFRDIKPDALPGKRVEVEGVLANGVLTAQKIALDD